MGRLHTSLYAVFFLLNANSAVFAKSNVQLPPSWTSGGSATEGRQHGMNPPSRKPAPPRRQMSDEAEFTENSIRPNRHMIGGIAALPELARAEYRYSVSPHLAFTLGISAPVPVKIDVSMPSDVIKADPQKGIAVAYPAFKINFKMDWGPHIHAGAIWHPFGGKWYTSFGAGVRSVRIRGEAASPLRVCSIIEAAKEPPCGNDSAAIQTRNQLSINADISLLSYTGRFATGWIFDLSPQWAVMTEAGIYSPFKTLAKTKVKAEIIAPDGTAEDVSGALGELRAKSQADIAQKATSELGRVTNRPLPVLAIGIGYRF